MLRVLAIGAHPDDLEILCAGTLARFAQAGDEVTMVCATDARHAAVDVSLEEMAATRRAEAERSAAIIGARSIVLDLVDGDFNAGDRTARAIMRRLVKSVRPDVIITHHPDDYHQDHREVSRLVFDSSFSATVPALESDVPALDEVPALYWMDTLAGHGSQPTDYVDITETFATKKAMLEAHASQIQWLMRYGDDAVAEMTVVSQYRGLQCGVAFAEAFTACHTWLRTKPERRLP